MGIFIYGEVSKSVTKEEWEKVFDETLILAEAFSLAYIDSITYADRKIVCAIPTKEYIAERNRDGWIADMDYKTLRWAETYGLSRYLVEEDELNPDAGDAMMAAISLYLPFAREKDGFDNVYPLWDAKTQNKPYHLYILAIACLIEDRLGKKAFFHGDISYRQCRTATMMANEFLDEPIRIPARCEMERLYQRVADLPLKEKEKIEVFRKFYLWVFDHNFGNFVKMHFNASAIAEYWKEKFSSCNAGTFGFSENLNKYLSLGFELEALYDIVNMEEVLENPQYKELIDEYLAKKAETDAAEPAEMAEQFAELMDALEEDREEQYNITYYTELITYKEGDTIEPRLEYCIKKSFQFYRSALQEEQYKMLMEQTAEDRCIYLIEQNRSLMLLDQDWLRIFREIEETPAAYERYYPMVRVRLPREELIQMATAFVINDEFYAYAKKLASS